MMLFYAVYDKKAMCYFPPFTVENKVQAIRGVEEAVNTPSSILSKYPEDFSLYFLGEFDNKTGRISQPDILMLECECMQLVRPALNQRIYNPSGEKPEPPKAEERSLS